MSVKHSPLFVSNGHRLPTALRRPQHAHSGVRQSSLCIISSWGCVSVDSQNVDGKPVPTVSLLFCHPSKHIIAVVLGARISRSRTAWHHIDDGFFINTWVGLASTASSRCNASRCPGLQLCINFFLAKRPACLQPMSHVSSLCCLLVSPAAFL